MNHKKEREREKKGKEKKEKEVETLRPAHIALRFKKQQQTNNN